MPFVQPTGPFAGYFVARTALEDTRRAEIDTDRYVDATAFPYIVFPGDFAAMQGTGTLGDFVMAKHLPSGATSGAIVADIGPAAARLGEISIALAANLGGTDPNPRDGRGAPRGAIRYVVFPGSHRKPKWRLGRDDIQAAADTCLQAIGGWAAIDRLP